MPDTFALVQALRAHRIAAVVSGAGPSVLALLGPDSGPESGRILDRLGSIVRETGKAWHISSFGVGHGARLERPDVGEHS
jgi:homoserine kinase